MKTILKLISLIGLILTIVPALMVFNGAMEKEMHKTLMFVGTVLWFGTVPFWMGKSDPQES
ncbi:hypothetical protein [Flexithrix dorotheae]|uniref:hypothetical protein n=1 Tax=Flexithrix dorotheae TaxID=70993 RepID=UPI000360DAED|nr:hypothetical protein [Flexithrix dorotheae]